MIALREVGRTRIDIMRNGERIGYALLRKDRWLFMRDNGDIVTSPSVDRRGRATRGRAGVAVSERPDVLRQAIELERSGRMGSSLTGPAGRDHHAPSPDL